MTDVITPERIAALKAKLASRHWRLRHLYWIQDKDGKKVLFCPNHVQEGLEGELHTRNLILKSRQHGITTWACIRALDTALFESNVACGIVADTKLNAEGFFRNKILYAYDNLEPWLQAARPLSRRDMNGEIVIDHGERGSSRITVGTSLRSGTYQRIHVSELGPMGAKYPGRAAETVSGTLNAINDRGIVTIESTAEGANGPFFTMSRVAEKNANLIKAGAIDKLSALDYKFHFLPWFDDPTCVLYEPVFQSPPMAAYFARVEREMNTTLRNEQRAWYIKKEAEQQEKMWSQFPSTPEEAFKVSIEGTYFAKELTRAEREGRITQIPFIPGILVNTFWDIGRNDTNVIWFHQEVGAWHHFIRCIYGHGYSGQHYARWLKELAGEFGYVYGVHYLPHDAENRDYSQDDQRKRKEVLEDMDIGRIEVVRRIENLGEGIEMQRQSFARCRFDRDNCSIEDPPGSGMGGLQGLAAYRKDWNEKGQVWSDHPARTWAKNFADAHRQFAQGYRTQNTPANPHGSSIPDPNAKPRERKPRSWRTA